MRSRLFALLILTIGVVFLLYFHFIESAPEPATEARIAVATNFLEEVEKLKTVFEKENDHNIVLIPDSTTKLYTKIKNGADFDAFLAADTRHPKRLEQEGFIVPGTFFVYARGKLVLWSQYPDLVDKKGEVLNTDEFQHLVIAPIKKAPYGIAAKQTLENLGLWERLWPRILQSVNLKHLYQLIMNDEADLGFIALSQLAQGQENGSYWLVPQNLYNPLEQGATLLKSGQNNMAARTFLAFMQSVKARAIIEELGYEAP